MRCTSGLYQTGFLLILWLLTMSRAPACAVQPPVATVYVFLSTECPISQQYSRQLAMLHRQFGPLGIRFVAWFPFGTDTPARIKAFRADYSLPFAGKPDRGARLAHRMRVRVMPEVVVVQADGRVRYQGAIDDWYVALGKHRSAATQHYLSDALNTLLTGGEVLVAKTDAVGCLVE